MSGSPGHCGIHGGVEGQGCCGLEPSTAPLSHSPPNQQGILTCPIYDGSSQPSMVINVKGFGRCGGGIGGQGS